jgi:hypothetical protein
LASYATISVPREVKKVLKGAKGSREWGEFLLDLYSEAKTLRAKRAFDELARSLTQEDLEIMVESNRKFRDRFTFRDESRGT